MEMAISNGQAEVETVLKMMQDLLVIKAADYTDGNDQFSNFIKASQMTGLDTESVFKVHISTKVTRIMELTHFGREPKNESIDDTLLDLANYAALWLAWRLREEPIRKAWEATDD